MSASHARRRAKRRHRRGHPAHVYARSMLIGIDWGGTKIEGVAMSEDGREALRVREDTPRGDYEACLRSIADIVARLEREAGSPTGRPVGIGSGLWPQSPALLFGPW